MLSLIFLLWGASIPNIEVERFDQNPDHFRTKPPHKAVSHAENVVQAKEYTNYVLSFSPQGFSNNLRKSENFGDFTVTAVYNYTMNNGEEAIVVDNTYEQKTYRTFLVGTFGLLRGNLANILSGFRNSYRTAFPTLAQSAVRHTSSTLQLAPPRPEAQVNTSPTPSSETLEARKKIQELKDNAHKFATSSQERVRYLDQAINAVKALQQKAQEAIEKYTKYLKHILPPFPGTVEILKELNETVQKTLTQIHALPSPQRPWVGYYKGSVEWSRFTDDVENLKKFLNNTLPQKIKAYYKNPPDDFPEEIQAQMEAAVKAYAEKLGKELADKDESRKQWENEQKEIYSEKLPSARREMEQAISEYNSFVEPMNKLLQQYDPQHFHTPLIPQTHP